MQELKRLNILSGIRVRCFQQKQMKMFRHLLEYHNEEIEPIIIIYDLAAFTLDILEIQI